MFKWGEGRKRKFECYSPLFLQGGECEGVFQHSLQEKAALSDVIVPLKKKLKGKNLRLLHPTNCPGVRLFANYVSMRRPIILMDLSSLTKIEIFLRMKWL